MESHRALHVFKTLSSFNDSALNVSKIVTKTLQIYIFHDVDTKQIYTYKSINRTFSIQLLRKVGKVKLTVI